MYNRLYRFEFYDTASPTNYTLLLPDFVVLCYDINDRRSLTNAAQVWFPQMVKCYMQERENVPVMLLGLKRDLRVEREAVIYPQEVSSPIRVGSGHRMNFDCGGWGDDADCVQNRVSESHNPSAATAMPNARPQRASS